MVFIRNNNRNQRIMISDKLRSVQPQIFTLKNLCSGFGEISSAESSKSSASSDTLSRPPFFCPLQSYLERGARTDPDLKNAC